jgi:hypothetical protein
MGWGKAGDERIINFVITTSTKNQKPMQSSHYAF